jgi:hypothetical protein
MTIFCTYCSAAKDRSEGELPAIQRYQDPRIKSVYDAANNLGIGFLILSGKYGILEPTDPVPYYDHLLQSSEVAEHSNLAASQLETLGVKDLIFFTRKASAKNSYCACIRKAAEEAGVELKFVYLPMNDA